MVGRDCDVNLRMSDHPEFDAWRWHEYWVPLDVVIEFKRDVYLRALQELSSFLTRPPQASNIRRPRERSVVQVATAAPPAPAVQSTTDPEHK